MEVCRGKSYTITLDGLTSGLNYNLFNAAAPQAGVTNAITSGEGNSAPGGTAYSGSAVTFTFTPNETTPDTVYLSSASNTSDQVAITVNDLAYVPGWATPAPSNQLILDDSDGTNTFTINTNNQSTNLQWTLPAIAPATNDKIMQVSTSGNITYVDKPQGYIEGTAFYNNARAMNGAGVASIANTFVRCKMTNEEWDDANIGTFNSGSNTVTITSTGLYEIQFIYINSYNNGAVCRLLDVTNNTLLKLSQPTYSGQYYNQHFSGRGYYRGTINANTQLAIEIMAQTVVSYGLEYSYWSNQGTIWDHGIYITKLVQ
jgi:hypothetical protein